MLKCIDCEFWYERNEKNKPLKMGVCTKNGGEWYEYEGCSRFYPKDISLVKLLDDNKKYGEY